MDYVRVGILPLAGLVEVNYSDAGEILIVGGQEAEFINMLSQGLGRKFTYSMPVNIDPEYNSWGTKINGSWTGLVGMTQREEVDLAVAKINLGWERSTAADYSYSYNVDELTFATRIPRVLPNASAFVNPFSTKVWVCFFILLFTYPPLLWLLLTRRYTLQYVYLNIFGSLLMKPLSIKVVDIRDRFMFAFWILGALVVALSYGALLLAFMTVPLREPGIRNIPELAKAAKSGAYKCGKILGTASVDFLVHSDNPLIRAIGYSLNKSDITLDSDRLTLLKKLYSENLAIVATRYDLKNLLHPYALIAEETFTILPTTLFLSRSFKYKQRLDEVLLRIVAGGLYQKTIRDYVFQKQLESASFTVAEEDGAKQLQIVDLLGAFVLLACGLILSLIAFSFELIVCHKKGKKTKNKKRH